MYYVFLDDMELPIAPKQINLKIKNQNKTVTLANEGEINLLKKPGLTDVDFTIRIPHYELPFARNVMPVDYYLSKLESLKVNPQAFQYIVTRTMDMGNQLYSTNLTVSLEDYKVNEDTSNGQMTYIDVKLKQFRDYSDIRAKIEEKTVDGKTVLAIQKKKDRITNKRIPTYTRVREGETLWDVVMRMYGNDKDFDNVKYRNKIVNPNNLEPGRVIWSGHI